MCVFVIMKSDNCSQPIFISLRKAIIGLKHHSNHSKSKNIITYSLISLYHHCFTIFTMVTNQLKHTNSQWSVHIVKYANTDNICFDVKSLLWERQMQIYMLGIWQWNCFLMRLSVLHDGDISWVVFPYYWPSVQIICKSLLLPWNNFNPS